MSLEFQKNRWNGWRDTAEKVRCSPSKVTFVIE